MGYSSWGRMNTTEQLPLGYQRVKDWGKGRTKQVKGINCVVTDGNEIFGGEHAAVFTEVETCSTHEFMNVINQCHLNKKHI